MRGRSAWQRAGLRGHVLLAAEIGIEKYRGRSSPPAGAIEELRHFERESGQNVAAVERVAVAAADKLVGTCVDIDSAIARKNFPDELAAAREVFTALAFHLLARIARADHLDR